MSRRRASLVARAAIACLAACSENPVSQKGGPPLPRTVIVSEPVHPLVPARVVGGTMSTSVAAGDSVVYVSAAPLTAPQGVGLAHEVVDDGGFDPEPVPAAVGDTIEVVITDNSGGVVVRVLTTVTAVIPPVVVRTEPPKKKIDVPLNTVISVVFSEPVAAPTLTPTSVELRQGPTVIPGTVRFRDSGDYVVEFVPATPLAPNTDYQLSVSQAVKSITGLALESPVSVDFTTGTEVEGPVAVVAVFPETALVQVGSAAQLRATGSDAQGTLTTGRAVTCVVRPRRARTGLPEDESRRRQSQKSRRKGSRCVDAR